MSQTLIDVTPYMLGLIFFTAIVVAYIEQSNLKKIDKLNKVYYGEDYAKHFD